jgi:Tol biopolymer transport system component
MMRRIFNFLGSLLGVAALIVFVLGLAFIFRSQGEEKIAWQPPTAPTPVPAIKNIRMSDTPGGPAVINFPSRASSIYLIFEYAQVQDTPVAVRTYDSVGNVLFKQTESYSGEGVETIGVVSKAGVFADGRYITNIYVGSELFVVKTLMWAVGEEWPTPTPRPVPIKLPTVTPAVSGTPTAVPTPAGPLPPGMKVVYAETSGTSFDTSVIWLASAMDPELRRALTTPIRHRGGWGVVGEVSPDGTKIAYLVIPPGTSERGARTAGGELWVMNSDGTDPHRVADGVGYLAMWAPDSHTLTFGRRIAVEVPWRTELYMVTSDGTEPRLLVANDTGQDVRPAGWSTEGRIFYYATRASFPGRWELWGVDVLSGSTQLQTSAPSENADIPFLCPDGTHLIFTVQEGEQQALVILSVDGREQRTIVSGAAGDQPVNQYIGTLSPDGEEILLNIPPEAEQPVHLERIDLRTGQRHTIPTEAVSDDEFFTPRSWSPDGEWLVVLKYPRMQSLAYLMQARGGPMVQIPLTEPSNWIALLGWIDQ